MAKRILLVEDDRFLRRAHEVGLRKHGFTVLTAIDGEDGLRQARAERPDLVLLDLVMPKLQGFEVLRMLKAEPETAAIPASVLSLSARFGLETIRQVTPQAGVLVEVGVLEGAAGFRSGRQSHS